MIKFFYIIFIVFLFLSCKTIEPEKHYSETDLLDRYIEFNERRKRLKRQASNHNLEQKALFYEAVIKENMPNDFAMIPKFYGPRVGSMYRVDLNAHLLAAMAFKYKTTKASSDLNFIKKLINSFYQVDEANGLDGYLPVKVGFKDGVVKILTNECHENVYVQLLFAYQSVYDNVPQMRSKIMPHLELIYDHFLKDDFKLHDQYGVAVPYSDLSLSYFSIYKNRRLSLLAMLEFGRKIFDGERKKKLNLIYQASQSKNYFKDIQNLTVRSLGLEFPTHSSSWLNYLKLHNAWTSFRRSHYRNAFDKLQKFYKNQNNPFSGIIAYNMGFWNKSELDKIIVKNLESFPLDLHQYESLNSLDTKYEKGRYVKLKSYREGIDFVPVYARPLESIEWKHNQRRLDGNFGDDGERC